MGRWPEFTDEEIDVVASILRSGAVNYWTGHHVKDFETEFADYVGVNHAIAVANGTLALEMALKVLGVGPGDEVIIPSRTYVATASSVIEVGAVPVFADIDCKTHNLSIESAARLINERTKCLICVHLAGMPCDLNSIKEFTKRNKLTLIEDCAQAHGAQYEKRSVGSFGDIGCWSFCQDKIMSTAGEGGMLTTDNHDFHRALWSLKDHGKNPLKLKNPGEPGFFKWVHDSFGSNYRMTEIQAAIGRSQLKRLDEMVARRRSIAAAYHSVVQDFSGLVFNYDCNYQSDRADEKYYSAAYRFYFGVRYPDLRDDIIRNLIDAGVPASVGSCSEIYREKCFDQLFMDNARPAHQGALRLSEESVALLCHPTLSNDVVDLITENLRDTFSAFSI